VVELKPNTTSRASAGLTIAFVNMRFYSRKARADTVNWLGCEKMTPPFSSNLVTLEDKGILET
jgi:hypothetical protein